jgi:hypothetical protein
VVDVSLLESFPFLTSFYGNDGTKFSEKAERRLSLSSSSPARRGNTDIDLFSATG